MSYQHEAPIGGFRFPADQNNHDSPDAYVTCIYCSLSMKINTHEKHMVRETLKHMCAKTGITLE